MLYTFRIRVVQRGRDFLYRIAALVQWLDRRLWDREILLRHRLHGDVSYVRPAPTSWELVPFSFRPICHRVITEDDLERLRERARK